MGRERPRNTEHANGQPSEKGGQTQQAQQASQPERDGHRPEKGQAHVHPAHRKRKLFGKRTVAIAVLVVVAIAAYFMVSNAKPYSVSSDGILSYGARDIPKYNITFYNETDIAKIYKVSFWSRDRYVYGLLSEPKNATKPYKAFILLPANSIPKEEEQRWLGTDLNKKGFAAFSIDQRGIGETGRVFIQADMEYSKFVRGEEPEQFKMFYDALTAFDVLDTLPEMNSSSIYMAGESLGGRVAIVAGAMEPRVAGVMGISTGGFGLMEPQDYMAKLYVRAVDPDNYAKLISPRKLLLLHSANDVTVTVDTARRTFRYAAFPKELLEDDGSDHGYYRHEKVVTLGQGLDWLVG